MSNNEGNSNRNFKKYKNNVNCCYRDNNCMRNNNNNYYGIYNNNSFYRNNNNYWSNYNFYGFNQKFFNNNYFMNYSKNIGYNYNTKQNFNTNKINLYNHNNLYYNKTNINYNNYYNNNSYKTVNNGKKENKNKANNNKEINKKLKNENNNEIKNDINKEIKNEKKKESKIKENKEIASEYEIIYKNILDFERSYSIQLNKIKELIPINELNKINISIKKKIFEKFGILEIKEDLFYKKLLETLKNIKFKLAKNILIIIYSYIQNKIIITNENEEIKNEAYEYFIHNSNKIEQGLYDKYIICFNIKNKLIKYFEKKENLLNLKSNAILLVKYLEMQNEITMKEFNIIKDNEKIDFSLINNLFHTYNRTEDELLELYNFIMAKIPKNSLPIHIFKNIFENNNFSEQLKNLLINNCLKMPENEKRTDDMYCIIFDFIEKYKLEKYFPGYKKEIFLKYLVYNFKFVNTAFNIIKNFDKDKIKTLDKSLLREILYQTNFKNIKKIILLLEYLPEEFDEVVKIYKEKNNLKYLRKIIKGINFQYNKNNKIIKKMELSNMHGHFIFKIKKFFPKQIDILIESIKNQKEFEIFFNIILRKIKNQSINQLSYIIKYAKNNGFFLPGIKNKKHKDLIQMAQNENSNIYLEQDKFGPKTDNCISYNKDEINVIFINRSLDLEQNYDLYFKNSEYIGIDTEWVESLQINVRTQTAIMQLSDYDGKNIFILDIIELVKYEKFSELFENLFKDKKFIAFDFENDLEVLPEYIYTFFKEKAIIIDIKNLYEIKYFEKCPSFSKVCEKIIGKPLCKYEQCSNWERRPLRQSQLHYAALDALLLCLVYKKIL